MKLKHLSDFVETEKLTRELDIVIFLFIGCIFLFAFWNKAYLCLFAILATSVACSIRGYKKHQSNAKRFEAFQLHYLNFDKQILIDITKSEEFDSQEKELIKAILNDKHIGWSLNSLNKHTSK